MIDVYLGTDFSWGRTGIWGGEAGGGSGGSSGERQVRGDHRAGLVVIVGLAVDYFRAGPF